MKKHFIIILLCISASIFAAGEEGTANIGTANTEGMPHLIKFGKIETVIAPEILPSGKDLLLTIITKRDDNPKDGIKFINQIDLKDNQVFCRLLIGDKYNTNPELSQLLLQNQRAIMARFILFLKQKNLLEEFCDVQSTFTTKVEEKISG